MKRKIAINAAERTLIVVALIAYDMPRFAASINDRFEGADPANDGPEVAILSVDSDARD